MSGALNNTIDYSSTAHATTQVLYGFRIREAFDLLRLEGPDDSAVAAPEAPPPGVIFAPAPATGRAIHCKCGLGDSTLDENILSYAR